MTNHETHMFILQVVATFFVVGIIGAASILGGLFR